MSDEEDYLEDDLIRLRIKTLMGTEVLVIAHPADTVELLKTRIAFQEGISTEEQKLLLGDRVLSDWASLSSLGIGHDSTLTMVTVMNAGRNVTLPDIEKRPSLPPILETLQTFQAFTTRSSVLVVMRQPPPGGSGRTRKSGAPSLPSIDGLGGGDSSSESGTITRDRRISSSLLGLNRLKGEMVLYAKRCSENGEVGVPPYSSNHLESYVRLKVRVLQEGKGSWSKRSLTPTVVANRKEEKRRRTNFRALGSGGRKENSDGKSSARIFTRPVTGRQALLEKRPVNKNRCGECRRKLGLVTRYECRCGGTFCSTHRTAETHHCTFDYKAEGRRTLALNNPRVLSNKLPEF